MDSITAQEFQEFLYNKDEGFLTKYHFNKGIDFLLLDRLYEILEELKKNWKNKDSVPKDILFYLISVIPTLYTDLEIYRTNEQKYYQYVEVIYALNTAIEMCLNPNTEDSHFNKPLRDLGF
jgi:hypothetical protein